MNIANPVLFFTWLFTFSITSSYAQSDPATLTITKNTVGGTGIFNFNTVGFDGTSPLYDDGAGIDLDTGAINIATGFDDNIIISDWINGDSFTVVENVPAGSALSPVMCSNGADPSELTNDPGDTISCTFVNTALGTIVIQKMTLPGGSSQTFDFAGAVAGSITDGGILSLAGVDPAGSPYFVTEDIDAAIALGWVLTAIDCPDGDSSGDIVTGVATINVDPGETVTCTYVNTQRVPLIFMDGFEDPQVP